MLLAGAAVFATKPEHYTSGISQFDDFVSQHSGSRLFVFIGRGDPDRENILREMYRVGHVSYMVRSFCTILCRTISFQGICASGFFEKFRMTKMKKNFKFATSIPHCSLPYGPPAYALNRPSSKNMIGGRYALVFLRNTGVSVGLLMPVVSGCHLAVCTFAHGPGVECTQRTLEDMSTSIFDKLRFIRACREVDELLDAQFKH